MLLLIFSAVISKDQIKIFHFEESEIESKIYLYIILDENIYFTHIYIENQIPSAHKTMSSIKTTRFNLTSWTNL